MRRTSLCILALGIAWPLLGGTGCAKNQASIGTPGPDDDGARQAQGSAPAPASCWGTEEGTPLHHYVQGTDPSFRWETVEVDRTGDGTIFEVQLVSQRWKGIDWKHPLVVFVPAGAPFPDVALLVLRPGPPGAAEAAALRTITRATGTAAAFLFDLPNQPLFDGREEDALLAYTFSQFLHTGDASWPLLFPMVKSVVRGMDVIEALSDSVGAAPIERFIVAGHSKRGHTAWLSGAADGRTVGIIPIANDVLNSPAQIAHHRAVAGEISASSSVFDEVINAADSPRGRCLIAMIDPYTYREELSEPKLVVLGTNDDYTPTDALNLYWEGLSGPKSVLYLPNTDHGGADSHPDVNSAAFAFVRAVAAGTRLPEMESALEVRDGLATLFVSADAPVRSARLWIGTSDNRDFRGSQWSQIPMRRGPGVAQGRFESVVGETRLSVGAHTAIFAELEFEGEGSPFKLSTRIHVVDRQERAAR